MTKVVTKKDRDRIHRSNKFYDRHMAGKYNHKEGEFNFVLSGKKKKTLNPAVETFECDCGHVISITNSTMSFICSRCNKFNTIS